MTPLARPASPNSIFTDQMTVRRCRLVAGLVMFVYLALHLTMHALGNVSWQAMEWGASFHDIVWKSRIGTAALYGAFAIHFALALWALYERDSLRMGAGEWARLLLGFTILPLLLHHFAAGRYVYSAFDVTRNYDVVLTVYFRFFPHWGWRQVAVLLIAWVHGCLGIHFWLRPQTWYPRYAPLLLALAVLLPALSLLGIWQGTREVLALGQSNPEFLKAVVQSGQLRNPAVNGPSWDLEVQLYWAYAALVALALGARGVRGMLERRGGMVSIEYPGGRTVRVPKGWAVLDASRSAGIPHASVCGGRGRCTTCRVRVLRGNEAMPAPEPSERATLSRLHAGANVRLACQLRPESDISVLPLLPPGMPDHERQRRSASAGDTERVVTILFVDIRRSTALVEKRLPYDVVFLLNHFFEAVAGSVVEAGGMPNQFLGDGMMAIFGVNAPPDHACRQALKAARLIQQRLAEMNRQLHHELPEPIAIGIGIHVGTVILGELGYRDHFLLTAIGDSVHVAARLQDLTKEYNCLLVASDDVLVAAGVSAQELPCHEVRVRGRDAPLMIRAIDDLDALPMPPQPHTSRLAESV
jgi:adenylate cyclase